MEQKSASERTAKDWAKRLSELMDKDEFAEFVWFFDGTDEDELWEELTEISPIGK